jgi:hypothetical protein
LGCYLLNEAAAVVPLTQGRQLTAVGVALHETPQQVQAQKDEARMIRP